MSRSLRSLTVAAAGLAVLTVASPAQAGPATTASQFGHVQFFANDARPSDLLVDVSRQDGVTTLDVEWYSQSCQDVADTWSCDYVVRRAFDVTPTTFDFSLRSTTLTAELTYHETHSSCSFDGEQETCTGPVDAGAGTTDLSITWTATEAGTTSTYRDDDGVLHVTRTNSAPAVGTAFGETYTATDQISVLSRSWSISR